MSHLQIQPANKANILQPQFSNFLKN